MADLTRRSTLTLADAPEVQQVLRSLGRYLAPDVPVDVRTGYNAVYLLDDLAIRIAPSSRATLTNEILIGPMIPAGAKRPAERGNGVLPGSRPWLALERVRNASTANDIFAFALPNERGQILQDIAEMLKAISTSTQFADKDWKCEPMHFENDWGTGTPITNTKTWSSRPPVLHDMFRNGWLEGLEEPVFERNLEMLVLRGLISKRARHAMMNEMKFLRDKACFNSADEKSPLQYHGRRPFAYRGINGSRFVGDNVRLHGDAHMWNFLVDDTTKRGVASLDYELACIGNEDEDPFHVLRSLRFIDVAYPGAAPFGLDEHTRPIIQQWISPEHLPERTVLNRWLLYALVRDVHFVTQIEDFDDPLHATVIDEVRNFERGETFFHDLYVEMTPSIISRQNLPALTS